MDGECGGIGARAGSGSERLRQAVDPLHCLGEVIHDGGDIDASVGAGGVERVLTLGVLHIEDRVGFDEQVRDRRILGDVQRRVPLLVGRADLRGIGLQDGLDLRDVACARGVVDLRGGRGDRDQQAEQGDQHEGRTATNGVGSSSHDRLHPVRRQRHPTHLSRGRGLCASLASYKKRPNWQNYQ